MLLHDGSLRTLCALARKVGGVLARSTLYYGNVSLTFHKNDIYMYHLVLDEIPDAYICENGSCQFSRIIGHVLALVKQVEFEGYCLPQGSTQELSSKEKMLSPI